LLPQSSRAQATLQQVQPTVRDTVHTIWVNGPTHTGKIGGNWPSFGTSSGDTSSQCTTRDDGFTGYDSGGSYCEDASNELNEEAHLMIYSGHLGMVMDAFGADTDISNGVQPNIFPKFGSTFDVPVNASVREIYDALPSSDFEFLLEVDCDGTITSYTLGTDAKSGAVSTGLVRQGHTMTQITITTLEWKNQETGKPFGECENFEAEQDPDDPKCHSNYDGDGGTYDCSENYPDCLDYVQGVSWGHCYSICDADDVPSEIWIEASVWGDSISLRLAWEGTYDAREIGDSCEGSVTASLSSSSIANGNIQSTADIGVLDGTESVNELNLFITPQTAVDNGVLVLDEDSETFENQVYVSSTAGTVLHREATRDVFVEVPTSLPKCGYDLNCASYGLSLVDMVAANSHATEYRTLRLAFSRNFETLDDSFSSFQSSTSAEITGLSVQLWDTETMQATGIPLQISKNWHSGSTAAYWAGYDGYWWTATALLHIPPSSSIALSLAYNVERYGNIPAWSHAQLSIVGYSDRWLWEEAALGTGGENICFDPLGTHTRAMITDVRPKLFDGEWKENVGGGDFLHFFGNSGEYQYLKELDPQLHSSGPCLSNASYTSITNDESIRSRIQVSGARTDDLVRVFFNVRFDVEKDVDFARMVFFQIGSETYNYKALHDDFVIGHSGGEISDTVERTCTGGTSKSSSDMYTGGPLRERMDGVAPWWVSMGNNANDEYLDTTSMVVGDEGLVIRNFEATLGGVREDAPSYSVLCDKFELGTPSGLRNLEKGDYVEMDLEYLILPRKGDEYALAESNADSFTLSNILPDMETWERVRAQAMGHLNVSAKFYSTVESHYPIRISATGGNDQALFEVQGSALGFVPIVISNLSTSSIPVDGAHGLWYKALCDEEFTLLNQGNSYDNDFWQANYDRVSMTYEIVYNLEIFDSTTTIAFGTNPDTWPECTNYACEPIEYRNCPGIQDSDSDNIPDIVDSCMSDLLNDADFDGLCDGIDSCLNDAANDGDSDNICDSLDSCLGDPVNDKDSDGICDGQDTCLNDPLNDIDGDGICGLVDSCEMDIENDVDVDLICGNIDSCPYDLHNDIDSDGFCLPVCGYSSCSMKRIYQCEENMCTYNTDGVTELLSLMSGGAVQDLADMVSSTAPFWWKNQLGCTVQWQQC
jgi:hypothetical protein